MTTLQKIPAKLVQEYFPECAEKSNIEDLENALDQSIGELLAKDFEKLLNLIYRIDIGENQFKIALTTKKPSKTLACLIIKRLIQKKISREKYNQK